MKHRSIAELHEIVFPAEHALLQERAAAGISDSLRAAYLQAILALPEIGRQRGWTAEEISVIRGRLIELRSEAIARERTSRITGLQQALHSHVLPYASAPAGTDERVMAEIVGLSPATLPDGAEAPSRGEHPATIATDNKQGTDDTGVSAVTDLPQQSTNPRRPPFQPGTRPPVAIVILTWNGLALTQRCLTSCVQTPVM